MSSVCRNLFIENTDRLLKIEKKLITGKAHWLQVAFFLREITRSTADGI
jgi:hypothetical protein